MNWTEYLEASAKTAGTHTDDNAVLIHAALGICGEAGEIADLLMEPGTREEIAHEIGDVLWYCALAARILVVDEVNHLAWVPSSPYDMAMRIMRHGCGFAEMVKKQALHGKDRTEKMRFAVGCVIRECMAICDAYRIPFEDVLVGNIAKLKTRYPNGFKRN